MLLSPQFQTQKVHDSTDNDIQTTQNSPFLPYSRQILSIQMSPSRASLHREGKSLCLLFILLVSQLSALGDWQASGEFRSGQFAFIKQSIDNAFDDGLTGQNFALNISAECNQEYDRFWNVVTGKVSNTNDNAVLFGYAFEHHWIWINDYRDGKFVIVWKDYNCEVEFSQEFAITTDDFANKGLNASTQLYFSGDSSMVLMDTARNRDIWLFLFFMARSMQQFVSNTVTLVGAFGGFSQFAVSICTRTDADIILKTRQGSGASVQWFAYEPRTGYTDLEFTPP